MKRVVLVPIFIFLLQHSMWTEQTVDRIYVDDFTVYSRSEDFVFKIGVSLDDIISVFGEPLEVRTIFEGTDNENYKRAVFFGFTIDYFCSDKLIENIVLIDQDFYTSRGLKIGDPKSQIKEKYGDPAVILSNNPDRIVWVYSLYAPGNLNVAYHQEYVLGFHIDSEGVISSWYVTNNYGI